MNNTFNPGRFGKYLMFDLRNAKNNFGLSLLINGCIPVIVFFFYQLIFRVFSGGNPVPSMGTQISAMTVAFFVVLLTFPTKVYGNLTNKREGSDFLMVPASSFEKWLSMILISCVILPVCFFVLLFGSDALLSLFFPASWPESIFGKIAELKSVVSEETEGLFKTDGVLLLLAEWPESILVFLLGALVFKKGKVAKTFLAIFALSLLVSMIAMLFNINIDMELSDWTDAEAVRMLNTLKTVVWSLLAVWTAILMAGTYFRIKTLKH